MKWGFEKGQFGVEMVLVLGEEQGKWPNLMRERLENIEEGRGNKIKQMEICGALNKYGKTVGTQKANTTLFFSCLFPRSGNSCLRTRFLSG